uniref:Uncharacterized protein n=1 Tax=Phytophthora fragariae TaxID=53985 RepID=A0A6A3ENQ1_9STRA|nr:hypothetical protein PF009_g16999 [Phytophthora fragariae]
MSPSKNGITMPTLELERHDEKMMQELAATLLQQNLDQYSSLAVTPDGHPDSRSWVSIQKREGIRVYKESTRQQQQQLRSQAATGNGSVKTAKVPPSLLLMGTIKGHLDDVLTASLVECYARGFYEFDTTNAMLNSMSLHAIASQWLSCVKLVAYAQSMKLARLLNCVNSLFSQRFSAPLKSFFFARLQAVTDFWTERSRCGVKFVVRAYFILRSAIDCRV